MATFSVGRSLGRLGGGRPPHAAYSGSLWRLTSGPYFYRFLCSCGPSNVLFSGCPILSNGFVAFFSQQSPSSSGSIKLEVVTPVVLRTGRVAGEAEGAECGVPDPGNVLRSPDGPLACTCFMVDFHGRRLASSKHWGQCTVGSPTRLRQIF